MLRKCPQTVNYRFVDERRKYRQTDLRFFDRRVAHCHDVKHQVFVPAFDEDEAVFGVQAAVELSLCQIKIDKTGRVLKRILVVLELAERAEDNHV